MNRKYYLKQAIAIVCVFCLFALTACQEKTAGTSTSVPPTAAPSPKPKATSYFGGKTPEQFVNNTSLPQGALIISGSWGYSPEEACVLKVPAGQQGNMTSMLLSDQFAIMELRSILENTADPTKVTEDTLICFFIVRTQREFYMTPAAEWLEKIQFKALYLPKKQYDIAAKIQQDPKKSDAQKEKEIMALNVTEKEQIIWFNSDSVIRHESAMLWKSDVPMNANNAIFMPKPGSTEVIKLPEPLQRSAYLNRTPVEIFSAVAPQAGFSKILSGGWGYTQSDAMIIGLPENQNAPLANTYLSVLMQNSITLRSLMEYAQPNASGEMMYAVRDAMTGQEQLETDGKKYQVIRYDVYALPENLYAEVAKLTEDPKNTKKMKQAEKKIDENAVKKEFVFWFDVTAPVNYMISGSSPDMKK